MLKRLFISCFLLVRCSEKQMDVVAIRSATILSKAIGLYANELLHSSTFINEGLCDWDINMCVMQVLIDR